MEDSPSPGYDDRLWNRERQEGRKEGRWSKADEKYLLVTGKEKRKKDKRKEKRKRKFTRTLGTKRQQNSREKEKDRQRWEKEGKE